MPRSTLDQALIAGICGTLDYGFAALIQDTVEARALRMSGATSPKQTDSRTRRRAVLISRGRTLLPGALIQHPGP
jgi:hypothetical protein